jgi:hypothetical protein
MTNHLQRNICVAEDFCIVQVANTKVVPMFKAALHLEDMLESGGIVLWSQGLNTLVKLRPIYPDEIDCTWD